MCYEQWHGDETDSAARNKPSNTKSVVYQATNQPYHYFHLCHKSTILCPSNLHYQPIPQEQLFSEVSLHKLLRGSLFISFPTDANPSSFCFFFFCTATMSSKQTSPCSNTVKSTHQHQPQQHNQSRQQVSFSTTNKTQNKKMRQGLPWNRERAAAMSDPCIAWFAP